MDHPCLGDRMLPLRPIPAPRETMRSLFARTAAMQGRDPVGFAQDMGIPFHAIGKALPEAVDVFAELVGTDPETLLSWTPVGISKGWSTFRGHDLPNRALSRSGARVCPRCIEDDTRSGRVAEGGVALRGEWILACVTICLDHGCMLVETGDAATTCARTEARDPTDFDEWIFGRLCGDERAGWLDQQPLHAATAFCRYLGRALLRLEVPGPTMVSDEHAWAFYAMGYERAKDGPEGVLKALDRLRKAPTSRTGGLKGHYPVLYERLSRLHADDPDYAAFRDVVRAHLVRSWPFEIGDVVLGEPVDERRLHTASSVAREFGLETRKALRILKQAELVSEEEGVPRSVEPVFDAQAARTLFERFDDHVTAKTFAVSIGATRTQFEMLVASDILTPAITGVSTRAVWRPSDGVAFLRGLLSGARDLHQAQHGWGHVSKVAQQLKIGTDRIVRAIQSGEITKVGRHVDKEGFASVYVDRGEVVAVLGIGDEATMTIAAFARSVGLRRGDPLRHLISSGLTPSTKIESERRVGSDPVLTASDQRAFLERFTTLKLMSIATGESAQKLTWQVSRSGVEEILGCPGIYHRDEAMAVVE